MDNGRKLKRLLGLLHGSALLNVAVLALTLPFLLVPPGSSIRPMGWALLMGVLALVGLVWTLPACWRELWHGRAVAGFLGMCLSVTPFPLASGLLHLCAWAKGVALSP